MDWWKTAGFEPWVSDNDEGGLLYHLAFEVDGAVIAQVERWRGHASWASLLTISMIDVIESEPCELRPMRDFLELWRGKLCTLLAEVVGLETAVGLLCEWHFDGHDVLFTDSRKQLTDAHESAKFLMLAYNYFAERSGQEPIDIVAVESSDGRGVEQHLKMFLGLAHSTVLQARERSLHLVTKCCPCSKAATPPPTTNYPGVPRGLSCL